MLGQTIVALGMAPQVAADAADAFFESNGVKIRYVMAGEGEPVVLIHGWMSESAIWGRDASGNTKVDTDGAKGFKFIAIDCRWHLSGGLELAIAAHIVYDLGAIWLSQFLARRRKRRAVVPTESVGVP